MSDSVLSLRIDPRDALCEKIKGFGDLPHGWDGDDALPAGQAVIYAACKLVSEMPWNAELPSVTPAADGEAIGLMWVNGSKQINATLHADDHLVWVKLVDDATGFVRGDEIDLRHESYYPSAFFAEVASLYG